MEFSNAILIFAPSAVLSVGVIDDLRSRKFHNWLFIACSVFGFSFVLLNAGLQGLPIAALGFLAGSLMTLPLVLSKVIGAGDMKLLAAAGILIGWSPALSVLFFALIWGAVFGVLRAVLSGNLRLLTRNLVSIVTRADRNRPTESEGAGLELNRIPFTVAILLGWMSYLAQQGHL